MTFWQLFMEMQIKFSLKKKKKITAEMMCERLTAMEIDYVPCVVEKTKTKQKPNIFPSDKRFGSTLLFPSVQR